MVSNRKTKLFTSLVAFLCFLAVVAVSCKRTDGYIGCEGVVCQNGGVCHVDTLMPSKKTGPVCHCPTGWEGTDCSVESRVKFYGSWNTEQTIFYSDSPGYVKQVSNYYLSLVASGTPTTFMINNFFNNSYYNKIICTLDSTNSSNFNIDTLSNFEMNFDHYRILWGEGYINSAQNYMVARMLIRFKNKTNNWQVDSVSLKMAK